MEQPVHSRFLPQTIHYDGSQLRTGWVRSVCGQEGDAAVAFLGGCDVTPEHMLDTEDLALGHGIRARLMLHFIIEHPGAGLDLAVARQRLLVCLALQQLNVNASPPLTRDGDDLYWGERKLSISVAAVSPTSGLIHFALNVDDTGAPVPTVTLGELGVAPEPLANSLLADYVTEVVSCRKAAAKVREAR